MKKMKECNEENERKGRKSDYVNLVTFLGQGDFVTMKKKEKAKGWIER